MAENTTPTPAPTYAKGSWQETLDKAGRLFAKSEGDKKKAGTLLWNGAQSAIEDWVSGDAATDGDGTGLYEQVRDLLGVSRKGDANKVKTVAIAVRDHNLDTAQFPNLSRAYAEARRLTVLVEQEGKEDDAAEEATSKIAEAAPKSTSKPEGAALLVLAKGVDEAARLLVDALGPDNTQAHRALLRALTQEIAGRAKPAPKPKKEATPKDGATPADEAPKASKAKAAPKTKAKPKPKPASAKVEKAEAASAALKAKAEEAGVQPLDAEDDDFEVVTSSPSKPEPAVSGNIGKVKARPAVVRRPKPKTA